MVAEANGAFLKATIDKRILNYVKQNHNEDEYGDNIGDTITECQSEGFFKVAGVPSREQMDFITNSCHNNKNNNNNVLLVNPGKAEVMNII